MSSNQITLKGVKKSYGGRVVSDIGDLTLGRHGVEGLIGPNGAGKTTLMSLITGKISADAGKILFFENGNRHDISGKKLDAVARLGLVRTNQRIQDFESLGILDSMLLSMAQPAQETVLGLFAETALRQRAHPAISRYLEAFRFSDPGGYALSAGEKKLLDIIRCLLLRPKFLLMDEPTVGLPQDQTDKVMEVVRDAARDEGMSVVIIEHDLDLIWNVCEYIHFMADGRIMAQGTPDEVRTSTMVREKYMGEGDA